MALDDETRKKLEQLKQEFAAKALDDQRKKQADWNAEQMATRKAKGGVVSASKRADGIAKRGKTKGRIV